MAATTILLTVLAESPATIGSRASEDASLPDATSEATEIAAECVSMKPAKAAGANTPFSPYLAARRGNKDRRDRQRKHHRRLEAERVALLFLFLGVAVHRADRHGGAIERGGEPREDERNRERTQRCHAGCRQTREQAEWSQRLTTRAAATAGSPNVGALGRSCTIEPMVAVLEINPNASPEYVSVSSQSDTERRNLRA